MIKGHKIVLEITAYHNCVKSIGSRAGESAFAMEIFIAKRRYEDALKLSETRHVLIEKDFTKEKER